MPKIEDLFRLHTAKSVGFAKHAKGDVAFITNGFENNGVVGFVRPLPGDRKYDFLGIVLSTFCEATVQIPPFIARGNGGSGLMVLEPLQPMTADQLGRIAASINTNLRWRYNWYRQATVDRIRRLVIPDSTGSELRLPVRSLLPIEATPAIKTSSIRRLNLKSFVLDSIFAMKPGEYHNAGELPDGETPLVSCGDRNNGIVGFVSVPEEVIDSHKMTISFNGMNTLVTKFHPYRFTTKDDVAVLNPLTPLRSSTLFMIQTMMGREQWRYNFYRKCFMEKLRRQTVDLPSEHGKIDEEAIASIVSTSPYWQFLDLRYQHA